MSRVALILVLGLMSVVPAGAARLDPAKPVGALSQLPGAAGCLTSRVVAGCGRVVGVVGTGLEGSDLLASADGRWLYVTGHGSLALLQREPLTGRLSSPTGITPCIQDPGTSWFAKRCLRIETFWPSKLALAGDGKTLYVTSASTDYGGGKSDEWTRFDALRRDPSSGNLQRLDGVGGCFNNPSQVSLPKPRGCTSARGLILPGAVTVAPDGRNVYVGSFGGIAVFRRLASGALEQLPGVSGCLLARAGTPGCSARPAKTGGTIALALSPNGRSLYAMLQGNIRTKPYPDVVLTFTRDPDSGVLTRSPGPLACLSGSRRADCRFVPGLSGWWWDVAMALAPDGRSLYIGNGRSVITILRTANGSLEPQANLTPLHQSQRGFDPTTDEIVVSPDGRSLYLTSSDAVLGYARDPASGNLSSPWCLTATRQDGCTRARLAPGYLAAVTVAPDGRNVYILGASGDYPGISWVSVFNRQTG